MPKYSIFKKCSQCYVGFFARKDQGGFCSYKCFHNSRKGHIPWNKGKGFLNRMCFNCKGAKAAYAKLCIKCNNTKFKKGHNAWNRGKTFEHKLIITLCPKCNKGKSKYSTMCRPCWLLNANTGRIKSIQERQNISFAKKGYKSHFWKGGITPVCNLIRKSAQYKEWRKAVFERDNYTCQVCNIKGRYLNVNHKKQFSDILKDNSIKTLEDALICQELWNLDNGATVCIDCHYFITFGKIKPEDSTWGERVKYYVQ